MKDKRGQEKMNLLFSSKKAQGMSTSTIILLILGLVILVVLILGFTLGWSRLAPWISANNNIETLRTSCGVACSTNSAYDFCTVKREVKDGVNKKFEATCNELSTLQTYLLRNYGIAPCQGLCPSA